MTTRITRDDLFAWANTTVAQGQLPQLMHRLIAASNASLEVLSMPFGDSIGRSGLDGFTLTSKPCSIVPEGDAVWEMGVDRTPATKANKDFTKRNEKTSAKRKAKTTYIQVTPRHWDKKSEWLENKKDEGWKSIKVYDVDDIIGFLDKHAGVDAWFSRIVGKPSSGLLDCEAYWAAISTTPNFTLKPQVLLSGRDELVAKITSQIEDQDNLDAFGIEGRSPSEVCAFAVACICATSKQKLMSRSIVVDDQDRWRQIHAEERGLILVLTHTVQPTPEQLLAARANGHQVIYAAQSSEVELKRLGRFELEKSLFESGVDEVRASQFAARCRGSDAVLLDSIHSISPPAILPTPSLPDRVKAALLLVGGWDSRAEGDREAIEVMCGTPYAELEEQFENDSRDPNGMLFSADRKYRLLAPHRDWRRYSHLISDRLIVEYRDLIELALTDDDPTAGLSSTDTWIAQLKGAKREFSECLRSHLLESMALAASIPPSDNRSNIDEQFCNRIVTEVLAGASSARWASLSRHLSILVEAAPLAVLDSIESGLQHDGPMHSLFEGGNTDYFASRPHTGVLWALERAAWPSRFVKRVCVLLAQLDSICGDLKVTNTPANSFRETLLITYPQTAADSPVRRDVIKHLLESDLPNAWNLVASLLPTPMGMISVRSKPLWRDWADGWHRNSEDPGDDARWLATETLGHIGDSPNKFRSAVELYDTVHPDVYVAFLQSWQGNTSNLEWNDEDRRLVWETINRITVRLDFIASRVSPSEHASITGSRGKVAAEINKGQDRYSILRERIYDKLVDIRNEVRPNDPVTAAVYAFRNGTGEDYFGRHFDRSSDYESVNREVESTRLTLIRTIYATTGIDGILRLSETEGVNAAWVGLSFVEVVEEDSIPLDELLSLYDSKVLAKTDFAHGVLIGLKIGVEPGSCFPADEVLNKCKTDDQRVGVLLSLPNEAKTWDFIEERYRDLSGRYWERIPVTWHVPPTEVRTMVRCLIGVGRVAEAIDRFGHTVHHDDGDWYELIVECFEAITSERSDNAQTKHRPNIRWELQELLRYIYKLQALDDDELQKIVSFEFAFAELFGDDTHNDLRPVAFERLCAKNPSLFVEAVSFCDRDDEEDYGFDSNDDSLRRRGRNCHRLLSSLSSVPNPGAGIESVCDSGPLRGWTAAVLADAKMKGYSKATTRRLAEMYASGGTSDLSEWPKPELCFEINVIDSPFGRSCLSRALQDDRGMHWVDHTGEANRKEAAIASARADVVIADCPAAAVALRDYASMLEREAKQLIEEGRWGVD